MNQDMRSGSWLQLRGRLKRGWARITGDEALAAEGNAEVVLGSFQESYGVAKKQSVREVTRGIDKLASAVKKSARSLMK